MPPAVDDAGRGVDCVEFAASAPTSILVFTSVPDARHEDDNRNRDQSGTPGGENVVLRMSLRLRCQPPLVTFRFSINVFGHGDVKTAFYFDLPRHYISSIQHTTYADAREIPELRPDDVRCLGGSAMRLCFLLDRPGHLVMPKETISLKGRSQSTLQTLTWLAEALDFMLFVPRKTLSEAQVRCLQQTITSPASPHDQEQQVKEHGHWLAGLYGGVGGRIQGIDADSAAAPANSPAAPADSPAAIIATAVDDAETQSESGDSTVATATPPAYRRSAATQSRDAAAAATSLDIFVTPKPNNAATPSPPPYIRPDSEVEGVAPAADTKVTGKGLGKRPYDATQDGAHGDVRHSRRRVGSPPVSSSESVPERQMGAQPHHAADLVLSKLDQILGSCQSLGRKFQRLERTVEGLSREMATVRRAQHEMQAKLEDTTAEKQRRLDELSERCEHLEETHGEIMDTLDKLDDKYESIELEIEDQVYDMVKKRLAAALETM